MENETVGTKITHPRDGRHEHNSLKGWTDGELYGRHESNEKRMRIKWWAQK